MRIARDLYVDECHTSSKEKIPTVQADDTFPVKGSIVYNTDTDSIWFGNGSDWAPVGSGAQITAIASTGGTFGITATPNPITGVGTIALADIPTVTPGDYTDADIRVDQQGRITLASNGGGGGGGGGITEITAIPSTGGTVAIELTPNPVISLGTIALADILTVTPGDYTNANITVDQQGRLTFAENGGTQYPLFNATRFTGTVTIGGASTFPGAIVFITGGGTTGAGTFNIRSSFTKQQIGPSLSRVTLSLNIGIAAFGMTQGGYFSFLISSDPAGLPFPPNLQIDQTDQLQWFYSAWTPYYTGTGVPSNQLQSKTRARFSAATTIGVETGWIGPVPFPGIVLGNETVPIEMDTLKITYYTTV